MAFEELKQIALSLEEEFNLHTSPSNIDSIKDFTSDQIFEVALAESNKEHMQDKINSLISRVEELEERLEQQNVVVELLQYVNRKLQNELYKFNENSSVEIDELNDLFIAYKQQSELPNMSPVAQKASSIATPTQSLKKMQSNLKLTIQVGELKNELAEVKKALSKSNEAHAQSIKDISQLENDKNEEKLRRLHAEKQRDAFAAAYEECYYHMKKIERERDGRDSAAGNLSQISMQSESALLLDNADSIATLDS
jgi:DNA-binding transcriptional MerR regulator/molybdopterin converting factor small subunit